METKNNGDLAYKLYDQGRNQLKSGNSRMAIELLKESFNLVPHYKTSELLGEALMIDQQHINAVLYLAAAAGLGKNQFRSKFLLAKALLALGDEWKADAIEHIQESIRLNPDYRAAKELLKELTRMT